MRYISNLVKNFINKINSFLITISSEKKNYTQMSKYYSIKVMHEIF